MKKVTKVTRFEKSNVVDISKVTGINKYNEVCKIL